MDFPNPWAPGATADPDYITKLLEQNLGQMSGMLKENEQNPLQPKKKPFCWYKVIVSFLLLKSPLTPQLLSKQKGSIAPRRNMMRNQGIPGTWPLSLSPKHALVLLFTSLGVPGRQCPVNALVSTLTFQIIFCLFLRLLMCLRLKQ